MGARAVPLAGGIHYFIMDSVQSETQRQEADRVAAELRAAAATPSQTNLAVGKRSATFEDTVTSSSSSKQPRNGSTPSHRGRPTGPV